MSMTEPLYRLQELDQEEAKLKKKHQTMLEDPEFLTEEEALKELECELQRMQKQLAEAVKDQHRKELDLKMTISRRQEIRGRLYDGSVTNMKELDKMTQMVEELEITRDRLEDSILDLMGTAEELEAGIQDKKVRLQEEAVRHQARVDQHQTEAEKLEKTLAGLPAEREQLLTAIPHDLISRYESVRHRMGSRPLARVESQVCSGCRVGISATVMREIKKGDRLVQCESCGRILHWDKE